MSKEDYPLEYVIEMMNGLDNGFSYNQVMFIYNSLNNYDDKAEYFRVLCLDEANLINKELNKLKRPEEIPTLPDINFVRNEVEKVEELDNSLKNLELNNTNINE